MSDLCPTELRRIAQNERLVSANQRGEAADALEWAADEIERYKKWYHRIYERFFPEEN